MRNKSAVGQSAVSRFSEEGVAKVYNENRNRNVIEAIGCKREKGGGLQLNFIMKMTLLVSFLFAMPALLMAQADTTQTHTVDMATTMRSNGKIYVVVAVLVIILLGLFFYLIRLDRKIGKLEKE